MNTKRFLIASILVGSWAAAQTDGDYAPPRTEWDQPDLQGVWSFASNIPLQRAERFGTREFLTSSEVFTVFR